jgi:hypothetical protein
MFGLSETEEGGDRDGTEREGEGVREGEGEGEGEGVEQDGTMGMAISRSIVPGTTPTGSNECGASVAEACGDDYDEGHDEKRPGATRRPER